MIVRKNNLSSSDVYKKKFDFIFVEVKMELYISIKYDEPLNQGYSRSSDELFRDLNRRFPNSVWEREGLGFKVTTFD